MKQNTATHLSLFFSGIDLDLVERMTFIFRQFNGADEKELKRSVYTADYSEGNAVRSGENYILIPFSREDTFLFKADQTFYMDTDIVMTGYGEYRPETPVVELYMSRSLFKEAVG